MTARFTILSIVIVAVLCTLHSSSAATIKERSLLAYRDAEADFRGRQSYSSEEGSDEDSDEYAANQAAHQAYIQAQQNAEQFEEDSDEDSSNAEDDDDNVSRRRRDVSNNEAEKEQSEITTQAPTAATEDKNKNESETATVPSSAVTSATPTTSAPTKKPSSVLLLIRDTIKKVTNDLPTQQYASNALQYFQLFEHFLEEAIDQVISGDDDDDEEEEASTNKTEIEVELGEEGGEEAVTKVPEASQPEAQAAAQEVVGQETNAVTEILEHKKPTDKPEVVSQPPLVSTNVPVAAALESIPTQITFV